MLLTATTPTIDPAYKTLTYIELATDHFLQYPLKIHATILLTLASSDVMDRETGLIRAWPGKKGCAHGAHFTPRLLRAQSMLRAPSLRILKPVPNTIEHCRGNVGFGKACGVADVWHTEDNVRARESDDLFLAFIADIASLYKPA